MSISSVIKEALSLAFSWLDGGLGVFLVTCISIYFVFKTVKLLCMPPCTYKLPDLPDSVDSEHTELAECFRDDFRFSCSEVRYNQICNEIYLNGRSDIRNKEFYDEE